MNLNLFDSLNECGIKRKYQLSLQAERQSVSLKGLSIELLRGIRTVGTVDMIQLRLTTLLSFCFTIEVLISRISWNYFESVFLMRTGVLARGVSLRVDIFLCFLKVLSCSFPAYFCCFFNVKKYSVLYLFNLHSFTLYEIVSTS